MMRWIWGYFRRFREHELFWGRPNERLFVVCGMSKQDAITSPLLPKLGDVNSGYRVKELRAEKYIGDKYFVFARYEKVEAME